MLRRIAIVVLIGVLGLSGSACFKNKKVKNPLAQVDSKQPDKVLFDRAMDAMKSRKYDVARLSLQTLINAYPDSEYLSRAKLAIGDSWYYEGTSAAWSQAENEYKDYQTFFPNTPEAAEAQLRVAEIHYKQMEKPDRDYTHAMRAEDEFRQLLLQYPDSKLADQARKQLLEVQEVLAEREYRIGRFYFVKQAYLPAIARLRSLTEAYPLYSGADEALFLTGQALEAQAGLLRAIPKDKLAEAVRDSMVKEYEDQAAEAYSKILTRYPAMARAEDAKRRLAALDRPIPKPTEDALALNKKEQASRSSVGRIGRVMGNFKKKPESSIVAATKVGQPTLSDPKPVDASLLVRGATDEINTKALEEYNKTHNKVGAEVAKPGDKVPESQPAPRSDSPKNPDAAAPAPTQVNEAAGQNTLSASPVTGTDANGNPPATTGTATATSDGNKASSDAPKDPNSSTSKKKKKKGIHKVLPF